jgi:hypothetical protein
LSDPVVIEIGMVGALAALGCFMALRAPGVAARR